MQRLLRGLGWAILTLISLFTLISSTPTALASSDTTSSTGSPTGLGFTLPQEPDEFDRREVEAFYDWRNNLFFRRFNMSGVEGDAANFMTARRTYKVSVNQYGYEVAVTFPYPLFYWLDRNGNGEFEPGQDEMWIDVEEDGLNGNEKLYDPMRPDETPRGPVPSPPLPSPKARDRMM
jgi:hypothetical protein